MTELLAPALRFAHLAALLQSVGALAFLLLLAPQGPESADARARILRVAQAALSLSLLSGAGWLVAQASAMAGAERSIGEALSLTLTQTRFGSVLAVRTGLMLLAALAFVAVAERVNKALALAALVAALALQPWLGHGAASGDALRPLATSLHVMAAALWLGALAPLLVLLRAAPEQGAVAARHFSPVGLVCVTALAASAAAHWPTIGDYPQLFGTRYGQLALLKTALFLALLTLAALNRFAFVPRAVAGRSQALRASLVVEAALGLGVIAVAVLLATAPPAAHVEPVWPFPVRPKPGLVDDAYLVDRLWRAARWVAPAAALLLAALALRRLRWPLAVAAVVAALGTPWPIWRLYVVEAHPTTFQRSPRLRDPVTLQQGAALFAQNCAGCHGADARGRGPLATGDPSWPPNLTAPLFGRRRDGDLFWTIRHGVVAANGARAMPGLGAEIDDEAVWALVDHIRARASAVSFDGERWPAPTRAPQVMAQCRIAGLTVDVSTCLSNDPDSAAAAQALAMDGAATGAGDHVDGAPMLLSLDAAGEGEGARACFLADADAKAQWLSSLAILTGAPQEQLAGAHVLIDGRGWLRRLWRAPPTREQLREAIQRAEREPVVEDGPHH